MRLSEVDAAVFDFFFLALGIKPMACYRVGQVRPSRWHAQRVRPISGRVLVDMEVKWKRRTTQAGFVPLKGRREEF